MPIYRVKDWERFQHYKDRTPPWIRLHRGLLDNYEYHCLPDASKALAPFIWLLASENKDPSSGEINAPDEKIAFRLHMTVDKFRSSVKPLIDAGFLEVEHDASTPLAIRKQAATPETETETEEEVDSGSNEPRQDELASPPDFKKTLFTEGLKLLGGNPDKNRPLVGRWLRDYGEQAVIEAFLQAQKHSPVEPKSYIEQILKGGTNENAGRINGGRPGSVSQQGRASWQSEGERLAAKYRAEAEREERERQGAS